MAARMVYFFVRHASLQRPLTAEGRGRLARVCDGCAFYVVGVFYMWWVCSCVWLLCMVCWLNSLHMYTGILVLQYT